MLDILHWKETCHCLHHGDAGARHTAGTHRFLTCLNFDAMRYHKRLITDQPLSFQELSFLMLCNCTKLAWNAEMPKGR